MLWQTAQRDGRRPGEGIVGRGCCARCWTPWMCRTPKTKKLQGCVCHQRKIPTDTRIEEIRHAILEKRNAK